MVIRILTGKNVSGAVRYNERKVGQGQAERIHIANYPNAEIASRNARFRLQLLEQYARLNPVVQKPSVHLAIAFHPSETLTGDRLREIGKKVMEEAGYGNQPYLVYQHNDTRHPHIHVVTVAVDAKGKKINDQFIKNRLQKIRRNIEVKYNLIQAERATLPREAERVGEGLRVNQSRPQTVVGHLSQTLKTFSFGSIDSLKLYLASQGIAMNTKAGRSQSGISFRATDCIGAENRPVKASRLPGKPTRQNLMIHFANQADRHREGCDALKTLLRKRLATFKSLTEQEYRQSLHQLGIDVLEREGTYLYVHKRMGLVALEDELGKPFGRQKMMKLFSAKTERMPIVSPLGISHEKKLIEDPAAPPSRRKSQSVENDGPFENQKPVEIGQGEINEQRQNPGHDTRRSSEVTRVGEMAVQPSGDHQTLGQVTKKKNKNRPQSIRR